MSRFKINRGLNQGKSYNEYLDEAIDRGEDFLYSLFRDKTPKQFESYFKNHESYIHMDKIKRKVGIIGLGMVGGALQKYFEGKSNYTLFLYDRYKNIGSLANIDKAKYVYICIPTPYKEGIGCDTEALEEIISRLRAKVIIIKSTIIPGTTERLQKKFKNHKILHNPEFLTEETADNDMRFPDRQIIGYTKKSYVVAKDVMLQLPLAPFERIVPSFVAEFTKYYGNTWFSRKVAMNNETYDLFKGFGGEDEDFLELVSCVSADKRIDRTHLKVYHKNKRGYGGKCLPKDTKAFLYLAKELGVEMPILEATDRYNDGLIKSQGLDPLNTDEGIEKKDA